jgi:hypothetical protein
MSYLGGVGAVHELEGSQDLVVDGRAVCGGAGAVLYRAVGATRQRGDSVILKKRKKKKQKGRRENYHKKD